MIKPYRYPGPKPFSDQQQHIFFGRDKELDELLRLVRREQWLVLYGKSGLGKSSLLNAGLAPRLAHDDGMTPVFVRFHAWTEGRTDTPLEIAAATLTADGGAAANSQQPRAKSGDSLHWFQKLAGDDRSLWRFLKEKQITADSGGQTADGGDRAGDLTTFEKLSNLDAPSAVLPPPSAAHRPPSTVLLIFDQFEELFTFPAPAIEAFAKSLAEVFYTDIPERYRAALEQNPALLSEAQLRQLHQPLPLRVVTAIRTDRMALMHQLKPFLPGTLDVCYELRPLSHAAAEEAVLNPAYDTAQYRTPRFDYADDALDALLGFLSSGRIQDIESFQLQILCEYLEKNVVERAARRRVVAADLADPAGILENYYLDKIGEIADPANRLAARRLIEEGLIFEEEERRLTLFEGQIQRVWGADAALLAWLEDTHLLRREPSLRGGYTYELSHDTLVAPVLKAKAKRIGEERQKMEEAENERRAKEQELREKAERAEMERERAEAIGKKREKTVRVLALSMVIVLLAVSAGIWMQAIKAQKEARAAEANSIFSQFASKVDELNAKESERKVRLEKAIVAATKNNAEEATRQKVKILQKLYKSNQEVAARLAQEAEDEISRLNYAYAVSNLTEAFHLVGSNKVPGMQKVIVETAFFYAESNNITAARDLLNTCKLGTPALTRDDLRAHLRRVDDAQYEALRKKYYPLDLVPVPGGTFEMGCIPNNYGCEDIETLHPAKVGGFQIAKTETTFLQYNLFCSATARTLPSPSWGYEGSDPIVNVSWFDALEYANWVSQQLGLASPYTLGTQDGANTASLNGSANGFRLPTEVEWEYAARGGTNAERFRFSGSNNLDAAAWYSENSIQNGLRRTHPVRSKKLANQLGLYDMTGNVWEWCWDGYAAYPNWSPSGYSGPANGNNRILRGGSFESFEQESRVTFRNQTNPYLTSDNTGFRLVRGE